MFLLIDSFFEDHEISWKNCSSVCTDGAAAMVSKQVFKDCSSHLE